MKILRISSVVLLFVTSLGAFHGSYALLKDPSGESMHLPLSHLQYSPFPNYIIPGYLLLFAIGLPSVLILGSALIGYKNYPKLILAQGCILTVWIITQRFMLQYVYYVHEIMGIIGILLITFGLISICQQKKIES